MKTYKKEKQRIKAPVEKRPAEAGTTRGGKAGPPEGGTTCAHAQIEKARPLTPDPSPTAGRGGNSGRDLRMIFRPYQWEAFNNRTNGIEVWLWSRQVGKSFTLAAWAVDRLILCPGRTVTMLSNSKFNGMELNRRCAEVCRLMGQALDRKSVV